MNAQEFTNKLSREISSITQDSFKSISEILTRTNNGRSAAAEYGQARVDSYHRLPDLLNHSGYFADEALRRLVNATIQGTGGNLDFQDIKINYDPVTFEITLSGKVTGDWGSSTVSSIPVEWFSPKWNKMTASERSYKWPIHTGPAMNVTKQEYERRTINK